MRLLLVEDDTRLARSLLEGFSEEGFLVEHAPDGRVALERLGQGGFDLCVLDGLLPEIDGFEVIERARAAGIETPILMLTARDSVPDRVRGLTLGADDYLVKPFAFAELLARIHTLLRRAAGQRDGRLRQGALELDPPLHRVTLEGREIALSPRQFALLELLLRHRGQVVTRAMILERVFGYTFDPGTNLIDVHVANLRQKLGQAPDATIHTVRGVGYRLGPEATR